MNTEFLLVKKEFTQLEKEMLSQELVARLNEKQEEENKKKASNKDFGARIKNLSNQISTLGKQIRQGFIEEEVECRIEKDFNKGVKNYFDKSTGDLLYTQKLTP